MAGPAGVAALLRLVERVEVLGLDSLWLHERHFSEPGSLPSPFVLGAAIGARTRRLRIGVCATVTLDHPLRVAEDLAVLDVLTNGRTIFSPMRGFRAQEFAAFGVLARTKYSRFAAALRTMQAAWQSDTEHGGVAAVPAVRPHPVQPTVPMWLGSFGSRGVDLAADLGLPYFGAPVESFAGLQAKRAQYVARCRPGALPTEWPIIRDVYVGTSQRAALDDVARSMDALAALYRRWGLLDHVPDVQTYVAERGIIGDAAACREQLARYRDELGVTYVVCRMNLPGLPPERMLASLERFCADVAPFVGG